MRVAFFILMLIVPPPLFLLSDWSPKPFPPEEFPLHENITATVFWVGETGNKQSSWDEHWVDSFGGTDDPEKRDGYLPEGFTPKENPFYIALPYAEFDKNGLKQSAVESSYWKPGTDWQNSSSLCKNKWIEVSIGETMCYAQWEDVGPFETDDVNYVFGNAQPKNEYNESAGIDVSPAVRDYLDMDGMAKVNWRFISEDKVPDGPWKQVVTTSGTNWGN